MRIGVEAICGFGNFLYSMSLALMDINTNKRKNELFLIESKKCGFDFKTNKVRPISDDLLDVFNLKIDLNIIHDESALKGGRIYRGFNFNTNLANCQQYIQNVMTFSEKAESLCHDFLKSIECLNRFPKEYISLNIRSGDFKYYYNNFDERIEIEYYDFLLKKLPKNLPIVVSIMPAEESHEYKEKFKKYSNRMYFINDSIEYPMTLPFISKSSHCCLANSTFHWWGGFLNQSGIVYYPVPWFKKFKQEMWMPDSWMSTSRVYSEENSYYLKDNKITKKDLVLKNKVNNLSNKCVSIDFRNKIDNKNKINIKIFDNFQVLINEEYSMSCYKSGKDRITLLDKETKVKAGEIIKNSITKEYFACLSIKGKTSTTAWIGKEI